MSPTTASWRAAAGDLDNEPSLGVPEKMDGGCRLAAIKGLLGPDEPSKENGDEAAYAGASTERGMAGTARVLC